MPKKTKQHGHADIDSVRDCIGHSLAEAVVDLLSAHKPSVDGLSPYERRLLAIQALTLATMNVSASCHADWLFEDEDED